MIESSFNPLEMTQKEEMNEGGKADHWGKNGYMQNDQELAKMTTDKFHVNEKLKKVSQAMPKRRWSRAFLRRLVSRCPGSIVPIRHYQGRFVLKPPAVGRNALGMKIETAEKGGYSQTFEGDAQRHNNGGIFIMI